MDTMSKKSHALMPAVWMVFWKPWETSEMEVPHMSRVRSRFFSAVVKGKGNGSTSGGISVAAWPTEVERTFSTTFPRGSLVSTTACFRTIPTSAKLRPARLCAHARRCSGSSVTGHGRPPRRRHAAPLREPREAAVLRPAEEPLDEESPLEVADEQGFEGSATGSAA